MASCHVRCVHKTVSFRFCLHFDKFSSFQLFLPPVKNHLLTLYMQLRPGVATGFVFLVSCVTYVLVLSVNSRKRDQVTKSKEARLEEHMNTLGKDQR